MAGKKAKGGKGGKGKSKGGGGEVAKKSENNEKMMTFLAYFFSEARLKSIQFYKNWYIQQKIQVKNLRTELHRVEHIQNSLMRELIKDEEELTFKAVTLRVENSTLYHRLDYNKEAKLIRQKGEIQELFDKMHALEEEIEKAAEKERDMLHFEATSGSAVLEATIERLLVEIEERKKEYELTYERIQKKHDMSIEVSRKRAEIIISDVETVATQKEIDQLNDESIHAMDLNRRLRVRHEQMYKEYASLATIVKRLEEENRDYVQRNVGVEWNLLISGRGGVNGEDDSDDDGNDDNTDNVSESSVSENSDGLDGDEKQDSILSMKWMDESVISDSESSPSSINKEINFSDTASSNAVNNSSIGGVNKLASDQGTKTKKKTNPISSRTNKTSHHKANTPLKWLQKSHAPGFEHESVSYSQSPIVVSNNTTLSNNTASVSHQRKQSTLLSSHHAKTTTSSAHASPLSLRSASPLLSNVKTPELDSIKLAQLDKIFPGMYRYNLFEKCTAPSATTAFAQNIIKPSVITNSADQAFAVAAQVIEEHKEQQQRQPVSTHIDEQQLVRTNKVLLEAQRAVDELMTYEIVMRHKRIDDSTSLAVRGNQQRIRGIDPKTSGAVRYMGPLTASV